MQRRHQGARNAEEFQRKARVVRLLYESVVSDQPYSVAAAGIALGLNGRSHAPVSFFAERCSVLAEFSGLFSEHARREPEFPNVDTLHKLLEALDMIFVGVRQCKRRQVRPSIYLG